MIVGRGPEYKIETKVEDNPGDLITEIALYQVHDTSASVPYSVDAHIESAMANQRYTLCTPHTARACASALLSSGFLLAAILSEGHQPPNTVSVSRPASCQIQIPGVI